jgi:tRNA(fMet)-specific endonuclease VapC
MSQYILDTDHVSLWLQGHYSIPSNLLSSKADIAVTIITVQELFNGWVVRINSPSQSDNLVGLYTKFWTTVEFLKSIQILNFDTAADKQYRALLRTYPPLRKNRIQKDVRIAAIALSLNAVLVTRNQRDFTQVPGLALADWIQ